MERQILVEPLQKRFTVSLKSANREARNRSYPNASDCCGVELKQEKFCSSCRAKVEGVSTQRKIVKVGKQPHLIDSQALKQVKETLEAMEDVQIHTFLKELPEGTEDRFDSLLYALPVDKKSAQYAELVALMEGRYAIGKGVFNGNEYQVVLSVGKDNVLRLRKLVEEGQRYDFSKEGISAALQIELNEKIIEVEKQIIQSKTVDSFDITAFKDSRAEYEEKVIEEFLLNGKVPEVKQAIVESQEQDELARLQALLN